jgi:hypothetical protein
MIRPRFRIVACLLLWLAGPARAEHTGGLSFKRNDKVLSWQTTNNGNYTLTDRLDMDLDSSLSTSVNMTTGSGTKDRWYDTVYNRADFTYEASDVLDLGFAAGEDWNRDTMSRLGKSLITTDWNGSASYRPMPGLSLEGTAGYMIDRRFEQQDRGVTVDGKVSYDLEPVDSMNISLDGNASTARLKRPRDVYGAHAAASYLMSGYMLGLDLTEDSNRRGYFSDVDRARIEDRTRRERELGVTVRRGDFGNLASGTALDMRFGMGRRIIGDTANDDPQSTKFRSNSDGDTKSAGFRVGRQLMNRLGADWGFDYGMTANGVDRDDRRRTQTDIRTGGGVYFGFARTDTVRVTGWMERTRIDTPVGVANDRDELKVDGGVSWRRFFSDNFKTELDFRVLETHYVNIGISQSSQNKWMKTYLFSPTVEYTPFSQCAIRHTVIVYANWITYDFDSDYAPRSNISRRVSSETWADIAITRRSTLKLGVMFEENDYGRLTSGGNKIPAEDGVKRFGDVAVECRVTDWLVLTPMFVYSIRRDWEADDGNRDPIRREVDRTYGLDCRLFSGENGSVMLSGKRIIRETDRYPTRIRNYITLNIQYGF